ncbi:MAG: GIY-YIG nuclease family protein [Anaerolineales bacterium]|nr:GIY-YIG nuclease family protein [Anaerolineales bacterium]
MKHEKIPCVYILTKEHHTVLYTGVTSDLGRRLEQHQGNPSFGFSGRYRTKKLVYVEMFKSMEQAIQREKQIKGGSRQKKMDLITRLNPEWKDLSEDFFS